MPFYNEQHFNCIFDFLLQYEHWKANPFVFFFEDFFFDLAAVCNIVDTLSSYALCGVAQHHITGL